MAKSYTSRIGVAYDINTINKLAMRGGLKPLTPEQLRGMSRSQIDQYLKVTGKVQRMNRRNNRSASRTFRKNAKMIASENYKQAELMHGTIRQGLAELGTLGTEGVGAGVATAITRGTSPVNAITQNTDGGTKITSDEESDEGTSLGTEQGPVYAKRGRKEE